MAGVGEGLAACMEVVRALLASISATSAARFAESRRVEGEVVERVGIGRKRGA